MSARYVKDEENRQPKTKLGVFLIWFNKQFDSLAIVAQKYLRLALDHRKTTLLITAVMFVLSLLLIPVMGMSFSPEKDNGNINITVDWILDYLYL